MLRLCTEASELAKYGPLKSYDEQGLEEESEFTPAEARAHALQHSLPDSDSRMNKDPSQRRTGKAPKEDVAAIIEKTVQDAKQLCAKENPELKKQVTRAELLEARNTIKGAVMIAFPMNLPDWDPVRIIIEDNEDVSGTQAAADFMDPETCCLWWASKNLLREKKLSDFVGRNEKTKIVAKLAKSGAGAPVREAPLTESQQKDLMAYYYRKQEENKVLVENDDDSYLNAPWADTKSLKKSFTGMGTGINFRPR